MKKLLILLLIPFLMAQSSGITLTGVSLGQPPLMQFTGTSSTIHIDATTANAFLWATAHNLAWLRTDGRTHLVKITDSAGVVATAYVSTTAPAGGGTGVNGETVGSNLLNGWNFLTGVPATWVTQNATKNDADTFTTTASGGVYLTTITTAGSLYYGTYVKTSTASGPRLMDFNQDVNYVASGATSGYATADAHTSYYLQQTGAGQTDVTSQSFYNVTSPPPDKGVLLTSTPGGARGWASNGGINCNSATFTIQIY